MRVRIEMDMEHVVVDKLLQSMNLPCHEIKRTQASFNVMADSIEDALQQTLDGIRSGKIGTVTVAKKSDYSTTAPHKPGDRILG